jgi:hypothetical protein
MTQFVGFRITSDYVGVFCLVFSFLYFMMGGGVQAFKNSSWSSKEVKGLPMYGVSLIYTSFVKSRDVSCFTHHHHNDLSRKWRINQINSFDNRSTPSMINDNSSDEKLETYH